MHQLTNDRRKWGTSALLAGSLLAVLHSAWPSIWWRVPDAVVKLNGAPAPRARVYRSGGGQLLVWIREPEGEAVERIGPPEGGILAPRYQPLSASKRDEGLFVGTPLFAWVRDDGHPPVFAHHLEGDGRDEGICAGDAEFRAFYSPAGSPCRRSWWVQVSLRGAGRG